MDRATQEGFEAMHRRNRERVLRACVKLCDYRRDQAEDLTQHTFLVAFRKFSTFRAGSSEHTWLMAIAKRVLWRWRSRAKADPVEFDDRFEEKTPHEDSWPDVVFRVDYERAVARLSGIYRISWLLVRAENLTYEQAAERLGVPVGTVRSRVHRAAEQLCVTMMEDWTRRSGGEEGEAEP